MQAHMPPGPAAGPAPAEQPGTHRSSASAPEEGLLQARMLSVAPAPGYAQQVLPSGGKTENSNQRLEGMNYLACRNGAQYQPQWGISAFQDTSIVCLHSNTSFQKSWSQALELCGCWIHSSPTAPGKGPHSTTRRAMGIPGVSSHVIPEQEQQGHILVPAEHSLTCGATMGGMCPMGCMFLAEEEYLYCWAPRGRADEEGTRVLTVCVPMLAAMGTRTIVRMHAYAKEAEATGTVCLSGGPEKSYMGSKQPPGQRQLFPRTGRALPPLGWGGLICRGQESWQRQPQLIISPAETHLHQQP